MSEAKLVVADDVVVSLDYTLRLEDGEIVDTSSDRTPLQFLQGNNQIIPGLEEALYDMNVGDKKEVVVAPAEGYGEPNPDAYQSVPRDAFPSDMELEEGMGVRMRDPDSGQTFEAFVHEIEPDAVKLDFNHPLAGETLYFQVKIADLREATEEELTHGHVHGEGNEH